MATFLPTQEPGPEPTAQPLPSWLSYEAYTTEVTPFTETVTRIIYYPDGSAPPTQTIEVNVGVTTSIGYSVVQRPLLYTGPLPPPPLGTLYTLPGQQVPSSSTQPTAEATSVGPSTAAPQPTATAPSSNGASTGTATAPSAAPTANPSQSQGATGSEGGSGTVAPTPTNTATSAVPTATANPSATTNAAPSTATSAPLPQPTDSAAASSLSSLSSASASSAAASSASASSASASSASASSASASSASASSASLSSQTSRPQPTGTMAGVPPNGGTSGLSGGQIAGIVIGAFFGLLLLLLLLFLLCRRRNRDRGAEAGVAGTGAGGGPMRKFSDKYSSGFSRGGSRRLGTYAAIGAAGAGAAGGAAAAAAGRDGRGSLASDEWEEDQLNGGNGSGFFVVGGRDGAQMASDIPGAGDDPFGDGEGGRSTGVGAGKRGALGALGLGAAGGFVAAALGRRRSSNKNKQYDEKLATGATSDDDADAQGAGDERRGLMDYANAPPAERDMSQIGRGAAAWGDGDGDLTHNADWASNAGVLGVGAGGLAAAAAAGGGRGRDLSSDPEKQGLMGPQQEEAGQDVGSPANVRKGMTPSLSAGSTSGSGANLWGTPPAHYAAAGLAGAGAGAAFAGNTHRRNSDSFGGGGYTSGSQSGNHSSSNNSGSGSRSRGTPSSRGGGGGTSSNSTGTRTVHGTPSTVTSLPPPPRAPRDRPGVTTLGNIAPGAAAAGAGPASEADAERKPRIPSFHAGFGEGDLGFGASVHEGDQAGSSAGDGGGHTPALLGAAAAGAGLGALAAGHRDSGASTYSAGAYPPRDSTDVGALGQDDDRHSRFLSHNTPLLGPGASGVEEVAGASSSQSPSHLSPYGPPATGYSAHGRLSTIRSVGEFGEGSVGGTSALHSVASGSGSGGSASQFDSRGQSSQFNPHAEDLGAGQAVAGGPASFYTPPGSPRGTLGQPRSMRSLASTGGAPSRLGGPSGWTRETDDDEIEDSENPFEDTRSMAQEPAEAAGDAPDQYANAAAAGGIFGGLAAGWRRLTMGNTAPPSTAERETPTLQISQSSDFSPASPQHHGARHGPAQTSDPGLAADVRSLRASVHRASTLGHGQTSGQGSSPRTDSNSREASSGSGGTSDSRNGQSSVLEHAMPTPLETSNADAPSLHSSQRSAGGYSASVSGTSGQTHSSRSRTGPAGSRRSAMTSSTGVDSLSYRSHVASSEPDSSRSGSRSGGSSSRRTGLSEGSGSTGAASYSPSNLARGSTISTRGGTISSGGASRADSRTTGTDHPPSPSVGADLQEYASDGQSSRATAGGNSSVAPASGARSGSGSGSGSGDRKRRRSGSWEGGDEGGLRRLDSVREVGAAEERDSIASAGPYQDLYGHYPSATLGAAAMRQAQRELDQEQQQGLQDQQQQSGPSHSPQSSSDLGRTPRAPPRSLMPGASPAVHPTLTTTTSSPTLRALQGGAPDQPGSLSWRESPRVASASMRAAEAAAHLERSRAEAFPQGQSEQPRTGTRTIPPEWGPLESAFPDQSTSSPRRSRLRDAEQGPTDTDAGPESGEQGQDGGKKNGGMWPRFLRM